MGHENQGGVRTRVELEQQFADPCTGRGIEVPGRFIGEQYRRARHEGTRERNALLLAARELARIMSDARCETDPLQHLEGGSARIRAARKLERQHHILDRGKR